MKNAQEGVLTMGHVIFVVIQDVSSAPHLIHAIRAYWIVRPLELLIVTLVYAYVLILVSFSGRIFKFARPSARQVMRSILILAFVKRYPI